jgi:hypothetical protein
VAAVTANAVETRGVTTVVPTPAARSAPAPSTAPPAATERHVSPAPPVPDAAAIAALMKRADALLAQGDISAARILLRRAAEARDTRAALALAETYDPAALARRGVRGAIGDLALARQWYDKAREFASSEASGPPRRPAETSGRDQH